MKRKTCLTQQDVAAILDAATKEAVSNRWPVTIAVVDDGGHPLALVRLDDCAPVSAYTAVEKARTSAMGRRESKVYESMINEGRTAFLSAPMTGLLEGGVPIIVDGEVVGAVGVSGVKPGQDAQIAKAGCAAVKAA